MIVPRTRDIYIRCGRVAPAEVYCSIPENFPIVWTKETGELSIEVTPARGAAEVQVSLPSFLPPIVLKVCWDLSENLKGVGFQVRGLETISTPRRNGRGPDSPLKRLLIFI